jgi:putative ABC transport system permease protein
MQSWLREVTRRSRMEGEMDAELRFHIATFAEDLMRQGVGREEALRRASIEFGGVERTKEECRDARGVNFLESLRQDLRYGARMLWKNPGFTAIVIVTLGLGIGANTAVFGVANAIFFNPLPTVPEPKLLMVIHEALPDGSCCLLPPKSYQALRGEGQLFSQTAAYTWTEATFSGDSLPERVEGAKVSLEFLPMLGARFALGRNFLPEEFRLGQSVAILSYGFWQDHFGADRSVIGRTLRLEESEITIVGVAANDFDFPPGAQLWMPLTLSAQDWNQTSPGQLHTLGMLQAGMDEQRARPEAAALALRLEKDYSPAGQKLQLTLHPFREQINGNLTPVFTMTLMGAAAFLLLIACANVANLLLARGVVRKREITLRTALGAKPMRVVRQLLTESALLAALGALLGLALAKAGLVLLASGMPAETARLIAGWERLGLDRAALLFGTVLTLFVALLSGTVPAIQASSPKLIECLKGAGAASSSGPSSLKLRSAFVCAQVSLALILLTGAGLMIKGFANMLSDARSFGPRTVLTVHVDLRGTRYEDPQRRRSFLSQAMERFRTMPGVASACVFTSPPLSNNETIWREFTINSKPAPEHERHAILQTISANFFHTMELTLIEGRGFTEGDRESSTPVAIVSEKLARMYWPGESPIGQHLKIGLPTSDQPWLTVVGVVSNAQYDWTDEGPEKAIYVPFRQSPPVLTYLAVRAAGDPRNLAAALRHELASIDPALAASDVRTLERLLFGSLGGLLEVGGLMTALGMIGLCVAVVGVYGVMGYVVGQRTQELGIRMVLGASRQAVLRHVLGHGIWLTLTGVGVGLVGAIVLTRTVSSAFFGVGPTDALTFLTVALLLAFAGFAACYIPARRAMRVDPMVALRYE